MNIANKDGLTPIHCAINTKKINRIDCRINHILCPVRSQLDSARLLIDAGADVNITNQNGQTVLHSFILTYDIPAIEYLLSRGAKVNVSDSEGMTPLLCACYYAHYHVNQDGSVDERFFQMLKMLVDAHANVRAVDGKGRGVIHYLNRDGQINTKLMELIFNSTA